MFQCRLIVSTMCYQQCERFNHLLYPLIVLILLVPFLHGGAEYVALAFYTVIVALAHLHYGISVVCTKKNVVKSQITSRILGKILWDNINFLMFYQCNINVQLTLPHLPSPYSVNMCAVIRFSNDYEMKMNPTLQWEQGGHRLRCVFRPGL